MKSKRREGDEGRLEAKIGGSRGQLLKQFVAKNVMSEEKKREEGPKTCVAKEKKKIGKTPKLTAVGSCDRESNEANYLGGEGWRGEKSQVWGGREGKTTSLAYESSGKRIGLVRR